MTAVAIHAVVHVAADTLVLLVGLLLLVAVGALEHGIVVWVGVADAAHATGAAMVHIPPGVVEVRVSPNLSVMTRLARGREMRRDMVRIVGVLIVGRVAAVAISRQPRPVIVDVAIGALPRRYRVGSGQREPGLTVIKLTVGPLDRIVTVLTGRWPTH